MAYGLKYFFTGFSLQGEALQVDFKLRDYEGPATEIGAAANAIQIDYDNLDSDKIKPIIGSRAVFNLIANQSFSSLDFYSDDELAWLCEVKKIPALGEPVTVNVSLNEVFNGTNVDANLQVKRYPGGTGTPIVEADLFTNGATASFTAFTGDRLTFEAYSELAWPAGTVARRIDVTGFTSQLGTNQAASNVKDLTLTQPVDINASVSVLWYENPTYLNLRSEMFTAECPGGNGQELAYTKLYTSEISQSDADSQAAADTDFSEEGQEYVNANGACLSDNYVTWRGFIQPASCIEDFTTDGNRLASIEAVDGLALLSAFSFAQESGDLYIGKLSPRQIIYYCLKRVYKDGIELHTLCQVYEASMDVARSTLDQCKFNSERYLGERSVPKTALDVLTSVLRNFGMQIRQEGGVFKVYRVIDLVGSTKTWFRYDANGTAAGTISRNLYQNVGYQETRFLGTDTTLKPDRPYKNVKIRYEYGYLSNILLNYPDGWIKSPSLEYTEHDGSITIFTNGTWNLNDYLKSPLIHVVTGDSFTFSGSSYSLNEFASPVYQFKLTTASGVYYLGKLDGWVQSAVTVRFSHTIKELATTKRSGVYELILPPIPEDGDLELFIYEGFDTRRAPSTSYITVYNTPYLTVNKPESETAKGEYYISVNPANYRYEPDTIEVFNADDTSDAYMGTIYREDGVTPTVSWSTPLIEDKPLLTIISEEILRLYQKPYYIIEGEINDLINPLSVWDVYDDGKYYMAAGMNYDLVTGYTRAVLVEITDSPIPDFVANDPELDFGQYESGLPQIGVGSTPTTPGVTPGTPVTNETLNELIRDRLVMGTIIATAPIYSNDEDAVAGGLEPGDYYKTPTGQIQYVLEGQAFDYTLNFSFYE